MNKKILPFFADPGMKETNIYFLRHDGNLMIQQRLTLNTLSRESESRHTYNNSN